MFDPATPARITSAAAAADAVCGDQSTMPSMEKVAILACGSFNPVTHMHLRMFELAKDYLIRRQNFQVVAGIISPVNDHYPTNKYLAPARHRIAMLKLALRPLHGQPHWVRMDDWECRQDHWMRTAEVLKHHQQHLNENTVGNIRLMLLCGSDLFESFNTPNLWADRDIETIVRDHGLLVVTRSSADPWRTLKHSSKSQILLKHEKNIRIIELKCPNSVSSTYLREAIARNESIRYLTEDPVIEYIEENQLYR